jgi:threonine dehydrogenase-like Zn-dependent dehydrogenase
MTVLPRETRKLPVSFTSTAQSFWIREPGIGEIRTVDLPRPGPSEVLVRTRWSAVSSGTEALVFRGQVPVDQYATMRAPFQQGDFPAPVAYGYLSVGTVDEGPHHLRGRTVFCLHPHQTAYVVPATAVIPVPDGVPARRAVLAGTVETAVNALWDAAPLIGDRVACVGAGMVGCSIARLLAGIPGVEVTLVDINPARAEVAAQLGVAFATPDRAPTDLDLVVDTSASAAGLQRALELLAPEGRVIELSWYGDRDVSLKLGGAFHHRRLTIRSSQVGTVSPARSGSRSTTDRLDLALRLLRDPAFDALLTDTWAFEQLPTVLEDVAAGHLPGICHLIDYGRVDDPEPNLQEEHR